MITEKGEALQVGAWPERAPRGQVDKTRPQYERNFLCSHSVRTWRAREASLLEPHLELLLDQDVQVALVLQVPCGQLGVRAASPKDIRPSGPFDRPA